MRIGKGLWWNAKELLYSKSREPSEKLLSRQETLTDLMFRVIIQGEMWEMAKDM